MDCYGGDFGEQLHDANFVADGLLFPDRTPSPALADVKAVFSPVRLDLAGAGAGTIRVANRHEVLDLGGFLLSWQAEYDGVCQVRAVTSLPPVVAGDALEVALPEEIAAALAVGTAIVSLAVVVSDPEGREIAKSAAVVHRPAAKAAGVSDGGTQGEADERLSGEVLERELRALFGEFTIEPRLWRAPIDNDRPFSWQPRDDAWRAAGLDKMEHTRSLNAEGMLIHSESPGREWALLTRITARHSTRGLGAGGNGAGIAAAADSQAGSSLLELSITQMFTGNPPAQLPQMGLDLVLSEDFSDLEWLGQGPAESYPDTGQGNTFGRFRAGLEQLSTPYVYPQENGARSGVEWACVSTPAGSTAERSVAMVPSRPVSLALRPWSTEDLAVATHGFELQPGPCRYLSIILASSGAGTASCGPGVLDPYILPPDPQSVRLQLSTPRRSETNKE
ncbi:hypothetical protein AS189_09145 [Arthrobacter alpinus]|uniref:beta-galactosidase n=1 Tax=Arthrobacter alpinus TaxID=656366 RepID=A0A0S2LZG3_9MICC|nr:glycoside hydrolase family 2 TIM barrel-domain containing protein [Arthrobacter alpinus]ALO66624.1 hypothetical protein AS189_09145 [Arthrobacter alpinus]